jgi:large subunit ribosomal protein L15
MPLYRRLAHRGFSNYPFRKSVEAVNLREIEAHYTEGEVVSVETLKQKGLVDKALVKILAEGDLTKKLNFKVPALSASAQEKIEKAGGTVTVTGGAGKSVPGDAAAKSAAKEKVEG